MARLSSLSVNDAWNAVSLEERLEIVSRAKGEGVLAALCFLSFVGSVAYGLDNILILAAGALLSVMVMQIFSSQAWRRMKPELILSYLAVRAVARRHAFAQRIAPLDIVLIFRGTMQDRFGNREEEESYRQSQVVDFHSDLSEERHVWICLLRGGLVMLAERSGGAKLEFLTHVTPETVCRKPNAAEGERENALVIEGSGAHRGRKVVVCSEYPGAMYVFEKQLQRLIFESAESKRRISKAKEQAALAESNRRSRGGGI